MADGQDGAARSGPVGRDGRRAGRRDDHGRRGPRARRADRGGRLVGRAPRAHPGADVSGSDEVAVMPGLISAHHHSTGVTSTSRAIVDDILELWILEIRRVRPGDPYLDTLLASGASSPLRASRAWSTCISAAGLRRRAWTGSAGAARVRPGRNPGGLRAGCREPEPGRQRCERGEVRRFLDALPGGRARGPPRRSCRARATCSRTSTWP